MLMAPLLKTAGLNAFRLTLNKPAAETHFAGAGAMEIEARLADAGRTETIRIRPVRIGSFAVQPIQGRGGAHIYVWGQDAAEWRDVLVRLSGKGARPFFTMKPQADGWYELIPAAARPARHIATCRFWADIGEEAEAAHPNDSPEPNWALDIRLAHMRVVAAKGRSGRPSKELIEAEETMALFRKLALELLEMPDTSRIQYAIKEIQAALRVGG